jgi:hypothetical protein
MTAKGSPWNSRFLAWVAEAEQPAAEPVEGWPTSILYHLLVTFWTLATYFLEKSFIKYIVNILPAVDAVSTTAFAANKSEGVVIKSMELQ